MTERYETVTAADLKGLLTAEEFAVIQKASNGLGGRALKRLVSVLAMTRRECVSIGYACFSAAYDGTQTFYIRFAAHLDNKI